MEKKVLATGGSGCPPLHAFLLSGFMVFNWFYVQIVGNSDILFYEIQGIVTFLDLKTSGKPTNIQ